MIPHLTFFNAGGKLKKLDGQMYCNRRRTDNENYRYQARHDAATPHRQGAPIEI